jgi:outer membrane cobalamin receptor
VIAGYNYVDNRNDSTSTAKHKYRVNAGYLENQFSIGDKMNLNISARVDDYSNFDTEFNPNICFIYRIRQDLKIRTSIGRSFRAPTFNDLYWPDEGYDKGNPNLKPEKGTNYELGFDAVLNKYFSSGITYYRNDFTELINWMPDSLDVWQPQNIGRATINGVELVNKFYILKNLEAGLNYAFIDARDSKSHKYLIYQPRNKIDFSIKCKEFYGFDFELTSQWTGQRFHDALNDIKVKPFTIMNFNVSRKIKQNYTIFFSMDNLLNRKYQVVKDYPAPKLSYNGGLKIEF